MDTANTNTNIDPEFARIVRRIYKEGSKGLIEMQDDVKSIVDAMTRETAAKIYGKTDKDQRRI